MKYWVRSLLGMAICLASLLFMTWALYHLVRTGTCASGGPYVSARPCPAGTGAKILILMGSIFGLLVGGGVYASRGGRGEGTLGMGVVLWSLLFISLAVATFVAAYGPANNDDAGARTAAIVLMIVFLPMGLLPLIGAIGFGGRRPGSPTSARKYPTPAPPQYPLATPAPAGGPATGPTAFSTPAAAAPSGRDIAARLRKLDELRDTGLLTDEEFKTKKAELLKEL